MVFSLPFDENTHVSHHLGEATHEFKVMINVRHIYDVHVMPDIPPNCRYAVGAQFTNLNEDEWAILGQFLKLH